MSAKAPATLDAPIEPDRIDGVAHPRETPRPLGHQAAEDAFLDAWRLGRPHHAWLLRGPPGIGKATFAYRLARFLLTRAMEEAEAGLFGDPPPIESLDAPADHPALAQIAAGAHPNLIELRRPWNEKTKTFRTAISVDAIRRMITFFHLSAADGGWRVALVDPADDLNTAAANALLKLIEEPPPRATFLLVAHAPGRLPATIRSRCRRLDFRPPPPDAALAALAGAAPEIAASEAETVLALADDAPGQAARLHALGGLDAYDAVLALFGSLPRLDRDRLSALIQFTTQRDGGERFTATARLMRIACERLARFGAGATDAAALPAEAALFRRLSPDPQAARVWATAAQEVADRFDAAAGLNLDPARSILDTALYLESEAASAVSI